MLASIPAQMVRTRRARAGLGEGLSHQLVTLPEPGLWSGYVLRTHGPALWQRRRRFDMEHGASVLLDSHDSALRVFNFGRMEEVGDAARATNKVIAVYTRQRFWSHQAIQTEEIAGESALRIRLELGRVRATEWRFVHGGWLFVIGVHVRAGSHEDHTLAQARRVLATWQWLEAGPSVPI